MDQRLQERKNCATSCGRDCPNTCFRHSSCCSTRCPWVQTENWIVVPCPRLSRRGQHRQPLTLPRRHRSKRQSRKCGESFCGWKQLAPMTCFSSSVVIRCC